MCLFVVRGVNGPQKMYSHEKRKLYHAWWVSICGKRYVSIPSALSAWGYHGHRSVPSVLADTAVPGGHAAGVTAAVAPVSLP